MSRTSVRSSIIGFVFASLLAIDARAEPVCTFENADHRLISGSNADDFRCIKLLAEAGDESQQYYLGLILIGQVPGPKNVPEGLSVLKKLALRDNPYSANAMRFIGYAYKQPDPLLQNYELAYQWLFLASQQPLFKGTKIPLPDEQLSSVLTPKRMKELERSAKTLLQQR